jgi:uncharacterized protein YndB with AHSA1/START domain
VPATSSETETLEHEVRIAAEPETVFGFFTDPLKMVQWMGADATLDPRPGGVFRLVFRTSEAIAELIGGAYGEGRFPREGENAILGRFVEVEPYRRITFTWGYEKVLFDAPPQATAVEVQLTPDGRETVLRLVHRRLPGAAVAFHHAGWEHYLPRLATVAVGGDAGPDTWQP